MNWYIKMWLLNLTRGLTLAVDSIITFLTLGFLVSRFTYYFGLDDL